MLWQTIHLKHCLYSQLRSCIILWMQLYYVTCLEYIHNHIGKLNIFIFSSWSIRSILVISRMKLQFSGVCIPLIFLCHLCCTHEFSCMLHTTVIHSWIFSTCKFISYTGPWLFFPSLSAEVASTACVSQHVASLRTNTRLFVLPLLLNWL